jgi:hypothetical protein
VLRLLGCWLLLSRPCVPLPRAHALPRRAQNLGNFMTDRNSSRVLAPPGGASSIRFGA